MSGFAVYHSDPTTVREHPAGRFRFAPGKRCSRLPPLDGAGRFARLSQDEDEAAARAHGARLATHDEALAIAKQAHFIQPVIVRETPAETQERQARGGQDALERMATPEWCDREDGGINAELWASHWNGDRPVYNAGKHWIARNPGEIAKSIAVNEGWQLGEFSISEIQTPGRMHDAGGEDGVQQGARGQRDYSQLSLWVWDEDKDSDAPYELGLVIDHAVAWLEDTVRAWGFLKG